MLQLNFPLYPEQELAVADIREFVLNAKPGDRRLYSSPTGTGKSVTELSALLLDPEGMLITPRLEIVAGMLSKGGVDCSGWNDNRLADEALLYRISTPIRFRNMLAAGTAPFRPKRFYLDEAHHANANTYKELSAYVPEAVWVGLTATAFRGSPTESVKLMDEWGGVTQILTLPQAVALGRISLPVPRVWPLLDDDLIKVVNGELQTSAVTTQAITHIQAVIERCVGFVHDPAGSEYREWTRPTMFSCPTVAVANALTHALNAAGLPADVVTQDTPRAERNTIFADALACRVALVQIDVVSEGVDLAFRRLIDLRPTLSPVKWMQQIGRIMRPTKAGEAPAEYYTINRNLERHGYLFEGTQPAQYLIDAQQAFENPTKRSGVRAFGLETMGRFAASEIPLANGLTGHVYFINATDQFAKTEYGAIVHPAVTDILYATRTSTRNEAGEFQWGKWQQLESLPNDLTGFGSATSGELSPGQAKKWKAQAWKVGLHPDATVNRRAFGALPMLLDMGYKLKQV